MVQIFITQFDYDRLMKLLKKRRPHDEYDKALLAELERGKIIGPEAVPPDVITMNSQVRFRDEYGENWELWLVFPEDAELSKGRISILSPIGCALIGYKKGDAIVVPTPKGRRELSVEAIIHQPEREGNYDL